MREFFHVTGFILITVGGLLVFGSAEPDLGTPLWHTVLSAVGGFALIGVGRKMCEGTERTIFLG